MSKKCGTELAVGHFSDDNKHMQSVGAQNSDMQYGVVDVHSSTSSKYASLIGYNIDTRTISNANSTNNTNDTKIYSEAENNKSKENIHGKATYNIAGNNTTNSTKTHTETNSPATKNADSNSTTSKDIVMHDCSENTDNSNTQWAKLNSKANTAHLPHAAVPIRVSDIPFAGTLGGVIAATRPCTYRYLIKPVHSVIAVPSGGNIDPTGNKGEKRLSRYRSSPSKALLERMEVAMT